MKKQKGFAITGSILVAGLLALGIFGSGADTAYNSSKPASEQVDMSW